MLYTGIFWGNFKMLMPRLSPGQLPQHPWGRALASQVCSWDTEPALAITISILLHPLLCFLTSGFSNSEVGIAMPVPMSYVTGA